jgi:hypothetical protein
MNGNVNDSAPKSVGDIEAVTVAPGQSNGKTAKSPKIGWVGVIVSVFIIGAIAHFAGWDENPASSTGETHAGITKAEWRQKARPFYNPGGGIKLTTVANFKNVMGQPSSTQSIEGHAYWYYDCADGTIQVVMIDPALSGGTLAIDSVNDY